MAVEIQAKAASATRGRKRTKIEKAFKQTLRRWAIRQRFLIQKAFKLGGHKHHGGRQWKKLAKSTVEKKGHDTILVDTGKLENSIRQVVTGNGLNAKAQFYSEVSYANYHDQGGEGGNPPRRPIFVVTKRDRATLREMMRKDVRNDLLRLPEIRKRTTNL